MLSHSLDTDLQLYRSDNYAQFQCSYNTRSPWKESETINGCVWSQTIEEGRRNSLSTVRMISTCNFKPVYTELMTRPQKESYIMNLQFFTESPLMPPLCHAVSTGFWSSDSLISTLPSVYVCGWKRGIRERTSARGNETMFSVLFKAFIPPHKSTELLIVWH